jgi:hypothetical protein
MTGNHGDGDPTLCMTRFAIVLTYAYVEKLLAYVDMTLVHLHDTSNPNTCDQEDLTRTKVGQKFHICKKI